MSVACPLIPHSAGQFSDWNSSPQLSDRLPSLGGVAERFEDFRTQIGILIV